MCLLLLLPLLPSPLLVQMLHSADGPDTLYNSSDVVNASLSTSRHCYCCCCDDEEEEGGEEEGAIAAGLHGKTGTGRRCGCF
jgi:hypothetical protein